MSTMDDLISRQAAIDALGEEPEVWSGKDEYEQGLNNQWHYDVNALKALPSAQSEIVRCGECKFWTKQTDSIQGRCALFGMYPTSTWFCGNARRREDAEIH